MAVGVEDVEGEVGPGDLLVVGLARVFSGGWLVRCCCCFS